MRNSLSAAVVASEGLAPAKGRTVIYDKKIPAFGLRVTSTGHKSFVLGYRLSGKLVSLTLGTWPSLSLASARELAKDALEKVRKGIDPAAIQKASEGGGTFGALADLYLTKWAHKHKKASSAREDERNIRKDLLPVWGNRKAKDIERRDVKTLVDGIVDRGAEIHANRILALISKIFNFGIGEDVIEVNPAHQVRRPGKERQRDRWLKPLELRLVWQATQAEPPAMAALMKLLLLTGQRLGEVRGMRWEELDFESGLWTIPAERVKNSLPHRVPLVGVALEILRELSSTRDSEFVFPGQSGSRGPVATVQHALSRVIERSGVQFRIHDLRRTVGTTLASLHIDRTTIKKLLNHSEGNDVTAIYDRHSYDDQKREALSRWDRHLREVISGTSDRPKVVALRS